MLDAEAERRLHAPDAPDACYEPEEFKIIRRGAHRPARTIARSIRRRRGQAGGASRLRELWSVKLESVRAGRATPGCDRNWGPWFLSLAGDDRKVGSGPCGNSPELAARGFLNVDGNAFSAALISSMLEAHR